MKLINLFNFLKPKVIVPTRTIFYEVLFEYGDNFDSGNTLRYYFSTIVEAEQFRLFLNKFISEQTELDKAKDKLIDEWENTHSSSSYATYEAYEDDYNAFLYLLPPHYFSSKDWDYVEVSITQLSVYPVEETMIKFKQQRGMPQ